MNNKRQTIWLVSMLSLMVVLSAYYLFSQDVNKMGGAGSTVAADNAGTTQISVDGVQNGSGQTEQTSASVSGSGQSDAAILQQMKSQQNATAGDNYFAAQENKTNDAYNKKIEQLMNIITNSKNDNTKVTQAENQMSTLEDSQVKAQDIAENLQQQYPNAMMQQTDSGWQVTVESSDLKPDQAVKILDMVTKQMGVSADQVSVKFVK